MAKVRIGMAAYGFGSDDLLALAKAADELGFDSFWIGEHYIIPEQTGSTHPGGSPADREEHAKRQKQVLASTVHIQDPWFALGQIAGMTQHLILGTAICIAPMLHPLLLARASATAHSLSKGRFILGLGAGWLQEEFKAFGIPFEQRGKRLDECVEILEKAWRGGFFEHQGNIFSFDSLQITPEAVDVPLMLGGNSAPAIRRIARSADAWLNSSMISLDEAERLRDEITAERQRIGADHKPFDYFLRPQSTDPAEIERFVEKGFDRIVLFGTHLWTPGNGQTYEEKYARLAACAAEYGLTPRK